MESTQDRQLAVPALAERARTLAARGRTATVVAAGTTDRPMPMLYQIHRAGSPQSPLPTPNPIRSAALSAPG
ncbi:MAG: hypothetical protein QOG46_1400, partial [Pseudonocardiales bacterium]|nr:hypothetical protein [Pseudonocardiales bacterium]